MNGDAGEDVGKGVGDIVETGIVVGIEKLLSAEMVALSLYSKSKGRNSLATGSGAQKGKTGLSSGEAEGCRMRVGGRAEWARSGWGLSKVGGA